MDQDERSIHLTEVALGSICQLSAGPSGSLLASLHRGNGGVPVIEPGDLTDLHAVDHRNLKSVPYGDLQRLSRFMVAEGDIVMVRQGAIGRLALIRAAESGWIYSSSCLRIRVRREYVTPEYLVAYLSYSNSMQKLRKQALTGTVDSLNSAMLSNMRIKLPPLSQQARIAAVLMDIEELIESQRALAERYQAMQPAVLHEMLNELENPE